MRLPLATDITSRDGTLSKDSLMKNAFAEKVGEEFDVFKRPGLAQAFDLGANQGQGLVSWKNTLFAVAGNSVSQGPTASPVADGTLWTQTSGSFPFSGDDNGVFYAFTSTGVVLLARDLSSPTKLMAAKTTDGITWTTVANPVTGLPVDGSTTYALVEHGGNLFCVVGSTNQFYISVYKSTNGGASWSVTAAAPGYTHPYGTFVVSDGTYIYKCGGWANPGGYNGDVWRSTDGITWALRKASAFAGRRFAGGTYYLGKLWVMGGEDSGGAKNDVYSSSDGGLNWTTVTAAAAWSTRTPRDNVFGYNNKLWLIGKYPAGDTQAYNSTDGATWTQVNANIGGTAEASGVISPSGVQKIIAIDFNDTLTLIRTSTNNTPGGFPYALTGAASLPISFSQTSGAASTEYLFLKTTDKAWILTFGQPGTLTQITDADYPAVTVPGSVYLDGYFFVMNTDGEIHNSDLEDPLNWNALNFLSAEIEPDNPVALAKHQNYVVALKDTTTELFYDAANASGSPLARLSNAAIQVGCANGYSVAALDAGLFFLSKFRSNQKSVHYFPKDGIQPVEIANPSIKRILTAADTSTVHCFACQLNGHSFYVITLPTEGLTLAYDLTTQTWAQWTFLTVAAADSVSSLTQADGVATATATGHGFADGDPVTIAGATPSGYNGDVNIKYIDANTFSYPVSSALSTPATGTITATGWTEGYFPFGFYTNALSKDYLQHETSGKIYEISADYGDDAGAPIDWKVRTLPLNQGTVEKKTMARLSVVGDNTVGNMLVRYSDDDYSAFSKYRQIDLSAVNKQTRRLGDYRERALDFRYTGDNKIRIRSIDIE